LILSTTEPWKIRYFREHFFTDVEAPSISDVNAIFPPKIRNIQVVYSDAEKIPNRLVAVVRRSYYNIPRMSSRLDPVQEQIGYQPKGVGEAGEYGHAGGVTATFTSVSLANALKWRESWKVVKGDRTVT
jgi:hypothetical protein